MIVTVAGSDVLRQLLIWHSPFQYNYPGGPHSNGVGKPVRWQREPPFTTSLPVTGRATKPVAYANDTQACYQKRGNTITGHFVVV